MEQPTNRPSKMWSVYLVLFFLIAAVLVFLVAFISISAQQNEHFDTTLTADSYEDEVAALLVDADPAHGDRLIDQYECAACHRAAANRIAPSYTGLADRAADRRPPLTAAAYIYESITHPGAYVVEGYPNAMLMGYADRLSSRELGDIIAYLLSPDAK